MFAESDALFAPTFKGTKIMKIENKLFDGEHLFMMTALYNNFWWKLFFYENKLFKQSIIVSFVIS
jgi:hypothetical protein